MYYTAVLQWYRKWFILKLLNYILCVGFTLDTYLVTLVYTSVCKNIVHVAGGY